MNRNRQILAASAAAATLFATSAGPAQAAWALSGNGQSAAPAPTFGGPAVRKPHHAPRATDKSAKAEPAAHDLKSKVTGPLQVIISLDKQELTLYSGDEVIARSRVSTGMRGRATPTGVFSIIEKDRWHRSNLYGDAPMWFMQRITWSGVALHQGIVPNYPASHGCIRMPAAFAQQMWTTSKLGARVIVAQGQVTPVEISHPNLFVPKPPAPVMTQAQALKAAEQAWTFAQLASKTPLAGATMTDISAAPMVEPPRANARPLKPGPVSVFISRKEGKLYVRKGFEPVFETPVTIERANEPIGTHVFTAIAQDGDALRWTAVTMAAPGSPAKDALDRITIPPDARDRIEEFTTVGASLVISDQGLGRETGRGTDFVVLTK